jgi:hypothetical protein
MKDIESRIVNNRSLPFAGWDGILEGLNKKLSILDPDYKILQVKEKFGELRFYYESDASEKAVKEAMDRYVIQAIEESRVTCEFCGKPGTLTDMNGWYKTICKECLESNEK